MRLEISRVLGHTLSSPPSQSLRFFITHLSSIHSVPMPVYIVQCTSSHQTISILFYFLLPDFQTSSKVSFYFVSPLLRLVFNFYSLSHPALPSLLSPIFLFISFILPLPLSNSLSTLSKCSIRNTTCRPCFDYLFKKMRNID